VHVRGRALHRGVPRAGARRRAVGRGLRGGQGAAGQLGGVPRQRGGSSAVHSTRPREACVGRVTARKPSGRRRYTGGTMDDPPSANTPDHKPSPATQRGGGGVLV